MEPSNVTTNLLLITLVALLAATETAAKMDRPPLESGLEWGYYESKCPDVESIIHNHLWSLFEKDPGLAAGLLRLHFHDCFVQGCDGSVLLEGPDSEPSEQQAEQNKNLKKLRPKVFETIGELQELILKKCSSPVVSCADIVAIAARDSVEKLGGPRYEVPLGRRDSLGHATIEVTEANISKPTDKTHAHLTEFGDRGLNATDLVALSGAHTIGRAHCAAFVDRLYPHQDPTLNESLVPELKKTCPTPTADNTIANEYQTPMNFDNKYYQNLVYKEGLFTSDEDLFIDPETKDIVVEFAKDKGSFFNNFTEAMIKMGQIWVLTGDKGEVRAKCSVKNHVSEGNLSSAVVGEEENQNQTSIYYGHLVDGFVY